MIKYVEHPLSKNIYLKKIQERKKTSRVYTAFQMAGLNLADILDDQTHKSLYIKLAKTMNSDTLIRIAKSVAENKNVKNKGAYFMRIVQRKRQEEKENKKKNGKSKKSPKRKTRNNRRKKGRRISAKPGPRNKLLRDEPEGAAAHDPNNAQNHGKS